MTIPDSTNAIRLRPFADDATETHLVTGKLLDIQVVPPLVEVQTGPGRAPGRPAPANNMFPSVEEATQDHKARGAPVGVR